MAGTGRTRGLLRGLVQGVRTSAMRAQLAERARRAVGEVDGVRSVQLVLTRTGSFRTTLQGEIALEATERAEALCVYDAAMGAVVSLLHEAELAPWGPEVGIGAIRGLLPTGDELTGKDIAPRLPGRGVPLPEITAGAFASRYGLH